MCGRFDIIEKLVKAFVDSQFNINFDINSNHDVRPTQTVATLAQQDGAVVQIAADWGIKPHWANKLLINAQSETVASKKTFAKAFATKRCLVPCSGWFEWSSFSSEEDAFHLSDEVTSKQKTKYYFHATDKKPLLMAGILFQKEDDHQLVTLTTQPLEVAKPYHHRMPLLISAPESDFWFHASNEEIQPLLSNSQVLSLVIEKSPY